MAQATVFVTSCGRTGKDTRYQVRRTVRTAKNGRLFVEFDGSTFWAEQSAIGGVDCGFYTSTGFRCAKGDEKSLGADEVEALRMTPKRLAAEILLNMMSDLVNVGYENEEGYIEEDTSKRWQLTPKRLAEVNRHLDEITAPWRERLAKLAGKD